MCFIKSGIETSNPDWVALPGEQNACITGPTSLNHLIDSHSPTFRDPVDSFEQFQAVVELCSKIFKRPAMVEIYKFLTSGNHAKTSFMTPNRISPHDRHQRCLAIQMGGTAAIRSVRGEFEVDADHTNARRYIESLKAGNNNTHLLISVKGTHHPLNVKLMPPEAKGASLIKIIHLYTETLQGGYGLTGSRPTSSKKKAHSSVML